MSKLVENIVSISWQITFLSSILAVIAIPYVSLGAAYHPTVAYAPYAPAIVIGLLTFVFCLAALSLSFTIRRRRGHRSRFVKEFGLLFFIAAAAAIIVRLFIPPVPDIFIQYAGETPYRTPREYTQKVRNHPGEDSIVEIVYCLNSWKGYYEWSLRECDRSRIELSKRPMTSNFDIYYFLDSETGAKIPRNGDRVSENALASKTNVIEGNGWTGYSASNGVQGLPFRAHYVVLDNGGEIILFGDCSHGACRIYSKTSQGVLQFEYKEDLQFQYEEWKEREEKILRLIESWQADSAGVTTQ